MIVLIIIIIINKPHGEFWRARQTSLVLPQFHLLLHHPTLLPLPTLQWLHSRRGF